MGAAGLYRVGLPDRVGQQGGRQSGRQAGRAGQQVEQEETGQWRTLGGKRTRTTT